VFGVGASRGAQVVALAHCAEVRNRHVRIQRLYELAKRSRECRGIAARLHDEHQLLAELLPAREIDDVGRRSRHPRVLGVACDPHDLHERSVCSKPESPADGAYARPVARRGSFVDDGNERGIWSIGPSKRAAVDYGRRHRLEIPFVHVRGQARKARGLT
jgi:hypothetical protein